MRESNHEGIMPTTLGILDLLGLLRRLRGLLEIDTSEAGLREWLRQVVAFGEFLTDLTGIEWDDDAINILKTAVESDEVYAAVYAVLKRFLEAPVDPDDPLPILDVTSLTEVWPSQRVSTGDEPAAFIPIPWITIIGLIIKLIGWIKERRDAK